MSGLGNSPAAKQLPVPGGTGNNVVANVSQDLIDIGWWSESVGETELDRFGLEGRDNELLSEGVACGSESERSFNDLDDDDKLALLEDESQVMLQEGNASAKPSASRRVHGDGSSLSATISGDTKNTAGDPEPLTGDGDLVSDLSSQSAHAKISSNFPRGTSPASVTSHGSSECKPERNSGDDLFKNSVTTVSDSSGADGRNLSPHSNNLADSKSSPLFGSAGNSMLRSSGENQNLSRSTYIEGHAIIANAASIGQVATQLVLIASGKASGSQYAVYEALGHVPVRKLVEAHGRAVAKTNGFIQFQINRRTVVSELARVDADEDVVMECLDLAFSTLSERVCDSVQSLAKLGLGGDSLARSLVKDYVAKKWIETHLDEELGDMVNCKASLAPYFPLVWEDQLPVPESTVTSSSKTGPESLSCEEQTHESSDLGSSSPSESAALPTLSGIVDHVLGYTSPKRCCSVLLPWQIQGSGSVAQLVGCIGSSL
jgi:hypothetical protein